MSCIRFNFDFYATMPPRNWFRYTPPTPDYTQHSVEELNMRRKAEILKYDRNETSRLTKKEKWAMIAKGKYNKKKGWYANLNTLTSTDGLSFSCNGSTTKCGLTSKSDVPGKIQTLCLDEDVPLYMYNVQRSFLTGSFKNFELFPTINSDSFSIEENIYVNFTDIGTLSAQDFDIIYNTTLTFKIVSGNDDNIFSIGVNSGTIMVRGYAKVSHSTTLHISVTNIFDFTSSTDIPITILESSTFSEAIAEPYYEDDLLYPVLTGPPIFSTPTVPPVIPPNQLYSIPTIEYEVPPIVPPKQSCDCFSN
tara:strand:- start:1172 stop:2089 length:918 start_codon:yes stop_codon:yes gene_type:complete